MRDAMRLGIALLIFLLGRTKGLKPNGGYCIKDQCFTVFQDRSDFTTAQTECKNLDGHLMTVRSSVSQDILVLLLGNVTGQFWIGLHLPTGCPDAASLLKGFQWVTKDSKSDFSDWSPSFDSSCSSPRCVAVSKATDFKWSQAACDEPADGFLCEHSFTETCVALTQETLGESVTYLTPLGFGGEELLSLPHGSVAVGRPSGSKYVCDSGRWQQGPWSCEIDKGGCEHKCALNSKKVPSCSCPPGKTINAVNKLTCETVAADPCVALRCEHECQHDGESHVCVCDSGFQLGEDGRSCLDIDECADRRQCPVENFTCSNTAGSFVCVCKEGFQMIKGLCVDEDECESAPCEHECVNSPGSYRCRCFSGYTVDPKSPNTCQLHCGTEECRAECDPNDDSQCNCPRGYILEEREDGAYCLDIDECDSGYCDQGCENTFGSYVCTCPPGFTLIDKFTCNKSEDAGEGSAAPATILPSPEPTRKPSAVSVGGLVGIILCAVLFVAVLVFMVHCVCNRREKMESAAALKAAEGETHGLERVTSDERGFN